jgi:hypothetical protein
MIMIDDAVRDRQREDDVRVMDVAQILEESMRPSTAAEPEPASS